MEPEPYQVEGVGEVLIIKPGAVGPGRLGAFQWNTGLLLAPMLIEKFQGKNLWILEVGSGLGLLSICLAKFGHKMVATDGDELQLPFIQENSEINEVNFDVAKLWWAEDEDIEALKSYQFDYIIGTDLIYPTNAECVGYLAYTIQELWSPHTEIIIAQESRREETDRQFEEGFKEAGFSIDVSEPWGTPYYLYSIKQPKSQ